MNVRSLFLLASCFQAICPALGRAQDIDVPGQCVSVAILNVDRGHQCSLRYSKLDNGLEFYSVSMTPDGTVRGPNEPHGPDDVEMDFIGYPTGLVGGADPFNLSGAALWGLLTISHSRPIARTDPRPLFERGEYFFIVVASSVVQKREWFGKEVLAQLSPATSNEGAEMVTFKAPGYCKGLRNAFGGWNLECWAATTSVANPNRLQFISSGSLPRSTR